MKHQFARNVIANQIAKSSGMFAGLLLFPYVAHRLGADAYAPWLILSSITTYLTQADLGMGAILVKRVAEAKARGDRLTESQVCSSTIAFFLPLAILLTFAFLLLVGATRPHMKVGPGQREAFSQLILAVGIFGIGLPIALRPFLAILQGAQRYDVEAGFNVAATLMRVAGNIFVLSTGGGIRSVASVELAAGALPGILALVYVLVKLDVDLGPAWVNWRAFRSMIPSSLQLFAMMLLGAIILQADNMIISIVVSASAVTLYAAGFKIYQGVRALVGFLLEPFLARSSELHALHGPEALGRLLIALTKFALLQTLFVAVPALICARPMVDLWLGHEYASAVPVALILLGSFLINIIHLPAQTLLIGTGRPGRFLPLHVAWCIGNIVLSTVLGHRFGITGIALGTAIPIAVLEPVYIRMACASFEVKCSRFLRQAVLLPFLAAVASYALAMVVKAGFNFGDDLAGSALTSILFGMTFLGVLLLTEGRELFDGLVSTGNDPPVSTARPECPVLTPESLQMETQGR